MLVFALHVFVQTKDEWNHHAKLLDQDGHVGCDVFGWRVILYLETVVVGAPQDKDNGFSSGSAYVFVRTGKKWTHQTKLLAPNRVAEDYFGTSVSVFKNTVVVGAHQYDIGFASVFV